MVKTLSLMNVTMYEGGTYLAVIAESPETDTEMAKRIADEERRETQKDERDRQEFERLKAKFSD